MMFPENSHTSHVIQCYLIALRVFTENSKLGSFLLKTLEQGFESGQAIVQLKGIYKIRHKICYNDAQVFILIVSNF